MGRKSGKSQLDRLKGSSRKIIVLGRITTTLGSICVVFVGFMLAQLSFFILQPECVANRYAATTSTTTSSTSISSASYFSHTVKTTLDSAPKSEFVIGTRSDVRSDVRISKSPTMTETPEFPTTAKFPPQCTSDQFGVLAKQLSSEGCLETKKPWISMNCSFSAKTVCGNANPHWFYDFVQKSSNDDTFRGIVVGCNKGYEAVELLRIVSPPSDHKYDLEKWKNEFSKIDADEEINLDIDCPIAGTATSNTEASGKKVYVYCIDALPKTVAQLKKTKKALGYGEELDITNMVAGQDIEDGILVKVTSRIGSMAVGQSLWRKSCKTKPETCEAVPSASIDTFLESKPSLKATVIDTKSGLSASPPIHSMSITAEGSDYDILKGAAKNLGRIQYIDFGYWNRNWGEKDFKDLILRLKKKGFVCYFTGSDGQDMWRITDCWQDHYDIHYPATVGCANANIPAAEPLLDKMEGMFLDTLKRTS